MFSTSSNNNVIQTIGVFSTRHPPNCMADSWRVRTIILYYSSNSLLWPAGKLSISSNSNLISFFKILQLGYITDNLRDWIVYCVWVSNGVDDWLQNVYNWLQNVYGWNLWWAIFLY